MKIKVIAFSFLFLNICYCADGGQTFESEEGIPLSRVHQQEETKLKERPQQFWNAFIPQMERIRKWGDSQRKKRAQDPNAEDLTILTRPCCDLYRTTEFEAWLALRFPKEKCKLWMAKEDSYALFPRSGAQVQSRFNEDMAQLADEMMEDRRRITSQFGAMGLALGDEKALEAARKKGDALFEQLMEAPDALDEDAVLGMFQPLEGDLAYQRYDAYKAGRALKRVQARMEKSNTGPLQINVRAQMKELLKGHIGHMMRHKLRFYKEALLFFYKGDLDAFNAKKGGVDDLWAHLSSHQAAFAKVRIVHEGDDMGAGSGMTLYGFLHDYQKQYREERAKARELLEEIQAGRAEMPRGETAVFKQLADPVASFDLDKDFKEAEKAALRRIHHIVGLEKELSAATGGLTVTEVEQKAEEAKKAYHAYAQAYEAMVDSYDYYLNGPRATLSLMD